MNSAARQEESFSPYSELKKRLKRMYPAYIVGVTALIMLYSITWYAGNPIKWLKSNDTYTWATFVEILGLQATGWSDFVYINGPAWYVSSLWTLVVMLSVLYKINGNRIYKISMACCTLIYLLMFRYLPSMSTTEFFMQTGFPVPLLRAFAGMCLGVLVYRIYVSEKARNIFKNIKLPQIWNTICLILLMVPLVFCQASRASFLLFIPISFTILFCFWGAPSYFDKFLQSKIVQYIGKISFSFYIMQSFSQNIVQIYISKYIANNVALNVCYFLLNFVVGSICYYIFEEKLPNYFANKKSRYKIQNSSGNRIKDCGCSYAFCIFDFCFWEEYGYN